MAGEWEKVKLVNEIQNQLPQANPFRSVLTLLKMADLKISRWLSWHRKPEAEQGSESGSNVIFQGLLWGVSLLPIPCMKVLINGV